MARTRAWVLVALALLGTGSGCCRFCDRWCNRDQCSNPCYLPANSCQPSRSAPAPDPCASPCPPAPAPAPAPYYGGR